MEKERRETEKMMREKVVDTLITWNKKIYILFQNSVTMPSYICDGIVAQCQNFLQFYKTGCCSLLMF